MTTVSAAAAARSELAGFAGQLIGPDDAEYEEARQVYNAMIDKRPALIARCAGPADVAAAIGFARAHDLPLAVRGGGHNGAGLGTVDDGVVIDLSLLRDIQVDPTARIVRVGGGCVWGEVDAATNAHGLATPSGIIATTGVGGLTLGGGLGHLTRKCGLAIDNLLAAELVLANGEQVRASADEHPDLYWAIRGGGGNFGVVTEFEFNLVPLGPTVLAGPIFWAMEDSPEVLRFYRDWVADAPDELMTIVLHRKAPPLPFVPEHLHGKPVVMVVSCWAGDPEEGEQVIRPMREFGNPVADVCTPKPYLTHQAMFDPSFVPGRWYYFKSCDVEGLTDEIIDITVDHSLRIESPLTSFPIWQMGGALARVGEDETAFGGRNAGFTYNIGAATASAEGFDHERDWVRNFWSALEPWHTSVYVNFLGAEGEERIRAAYGEEKYNRLKALKRKYDPDNFFRLNQNIPPN
jgi:FAD/FMN-containing dehydrogenase